MLTLAGCSSRPVPFPTDLPSQRVIDAQYHTVTHDISPLKRYHFEITIPSAWETLDAAIQQEPVGQQPADMGGFREPGEWMKNPEAPAKGEVTVTVVNASGSIVGGEASRQWLHAILDKTVPGYVLLQERTVRIGRQEAADVLIRYKGDGAVIARFWAVPAPDRKQVFVVIGSAPEEEYASIALKLFTALATFRML